MNLVGVVGDDFPPAHMVTFRSRPDRPEWAPDRSNGCPPIAVKESAPDASAQRDRAQSERNETCGCRLRDSANVVDTERSGDGVAAHGVWAGRVKYAHLGGVAQHGV